LDFCGLCSDNTSSKTLIKNRKTWGGEDHIFPYFLIGTAILGYSPWYQTDPMEHGVNSRVQKWWGTFQPIANEFGSPT